MALRLVAIVVAAPRRHRDGRRARARAGVVDGRDRRGRLAALAALPAREAAPLGETAREILRFVLQSSAGTGLVSLRGWLAPLLLGVVSDVRQVGLFRAAQAPQQGFAALSSPVRLILLTEQTRDWERGRESAAGIRRYIVRRAG